MIELCSLLFSKQKCVCRNTRIENGYHYYSIEKKVYPHEVVQTVLPLITDDAFREVSSSTRSTSSSEEVFVEHVSKKSKHRESKVDDSKRIIEALALLDRTGTQYKGSNVYVECLECDRDSVCMLAAVDWDTPGSFEMSLSQLKKL